MRLYPIFGQSTLLTTLALAAWLIAPAALRTQLQAQSLAADTAVLTMDSGTILPVRLSDPLTSKDAKPGDLVSATVATNVIDRNVVVVPQGTVVTLRVVQSARSSTLHSQNGKLALEAVSLSFPAPGGATTTVPVLSNMLSTTGQAQQPSSAPNVLNSVLWRTPVNRFYQPGFPSPTYTDATIAMGTLLQFSITNAVDIPR